MENTYAAMVGCLAIVCLYTVWKVHSLFLTKVTENAPTTSGDLPKALNVGGPSAHFTPSGKRLVRIFVSYAHGDTNLVEALLKCFVVEFRASRRYELDLWIDRQIMRGTGWDESIQNAIERCHFGLLMVSPAFLGRKYIKEKELRHFVSETGEGAKPSIPVGLIPIDFDLQNLHGLDRLQFFLQNGQCFLQMHGEQQQQQFVQRLYAETERCLDAWFANHPSE